MTAIAVPIAEAAALVGLHQDTLREAIQKRELPARRSGRKILVRVTALEEWFDTLPEASPEDER